MTTSNRKKWIYGLFAVAVAMNFLVWSYARDFQSRWTNVPPVPSASSVAAFTLGDKQLAYRTVALMLQNLGDIGGRSTPPDQYDYAALEGWFRIADELDPKSNFVPFMAAYYFGAAKKPENLRHVVNYLRHVGQRGEGHQWRWLVQAIYIARFEIEDTDLALDLANILASIQRSDLPLWTRQMPAFIRASRGEKDEAIAIMVESLRSNADKMNAAEINFTKHYICTRILDEDEAQEDPLCEDVID
jgi:hypothetical protein